MKLKLVIKQEWFDKIKSGDKTEEYREIKEYYVSRFLELKEPLSIQGIDYIKGLFCYYCGLCKSRYNAVNHLLNHKEVNYREYESVIFYVGYKKNRPTMEIELKKITLGQGVTIWGAEFGVNYFILKLGNIIEVTGCH